MIYIGDDIYRLKICQWAYGWIDKELIFEINKMIDKKQWDYYFEQKAKEEKALNDLIFEIKNRPNFDINLLKEEKHRSYGNKYIKRKFR